MKVEATKETKVQLVLGMTEDEARELYALLNPMMDVHTLFSPSAVKVRDSISRALSVMIPGIGTPDCCCDRDPTISYKTWQTPEIVERAERVTGT